MAPIKHDLGGSVLVVDDEVHTVRRLSDVLKTTPYVLARCAALDDVRRHAAESGVCAIVSEECIRKHSAQELLMALQKQNPDIPIIVLADGTTPMPLPEALSPAVFRHLTAPILPDGFLEAVAQAAQSYRMRKFRRQALSLVEHGPTHSEWNATQARFERALQHVRVDYQPILRARNGSLFGYQARLRCDCGDYANSESLLATAAQLGAVLRVGQTLRARIAESLAADSVAALFLNLHPLDLVDPDLHDYRREITQMASRVVIEISDTTALKDIGCARAMLASLRDRGFRMASSEGGSGPFGPSNFSILEPEYVKLDCRLIRGLDVSSGKRELIAAMTAHFHSLGLSVIADGVQTLSECRCATELGCDLLQGDFRAPGAPIPAQS